MPETTVMVKVCAALVSTPPLAVPPLSCAFTVTVATPFAMRAGVKVSVPSTPIAGWVLKSALLLFVTRKLTAWPDSFAGPARMFAAKTGTDCSPTAPTALKALVAKVKLGASFTGATVRVKVFVLRSLPRLAVPALSCATTVMVTVPVALASGVKASVAVVAPGV